MALIAHTWMNIVVLITNSDCDYFGSGFLVLVKTRSGHGRLFLVTARHVLCGKKKIGEKWKAREEIVLFLHKKEVDPNSLLTTSKEMVQTTPPCTFKGIDESIYRIHRDENIDLAILEVTKILLERTEYSAKGLTLNYFAENDKLVELDLTAGEDVYILGYPNQINTDDKITIGASPVLDRDICLPIIKSGTLATRLGKKDKHFYVDCLSLEGSSGSPIFSKRIFPPNDGQSLSSKHFLLGMVTNTGLVDAPYKRDGESYYFAYSGLTLAVDAVAIKEVISLFF